MPPRGKAKAKKEVEENGKERQVRQSRNVKAASYKDLSDSEDEKPIRKRNKKESESESMSEEEKPKARGKKGKRAPARSRKADVSDSEEASDFVSSEESSAEESSKRKKGGRKPARSLRTNQKTSYKDLSDSEEESVEEDEDSVSEKEEKSPPKKGRRAPAAAAKKPKKEESTEDEEVDEEEDVEDEAEEESEEEKKDKSKSDKPKSKPKSASADSSTDNSAKEKSESKEAAKEDKDKKSKPKPEHELSDEEEEEEDEEDGEETSSKKSKDDEGKSSKKGKDEETDSKKRSRPDKNGEATGDAKESEPQAKKAKVEDKTLLNKTDTDYSSIDFTSSAKTKNGDLWNLKISSWNVAGLRACAKKNGLEYVKHENPDILCLQEIKCTEQQLPPEAKIEGYEAYWLSGEKGQAGVALLSKTKPLEVKYGIEKPEFDSDGRVITAEYEKFYLVNTYVPNAGQGLKTLPRRLEWDPAFRAYLKKLDEKKPVILCGDLNVAHNEIDLTNPKTNQKSAGFTPQEREGMTELLKEGFVDTFRNLYPDQKGAYSFWSYFNNARPRNIGWRLDYFIASERFMPNICDNIIRNGVYGSDHCPITLLAHV